MLNDTLTAVSGIWVGHWTDFQAQTGCTAVLCPPEGCVASGFALGAAPGSREYALLSPEKSVERVHAVLLSGGSAFGLDAASGVMNWLEQQGRGFITPFGKVPIVPAAVIFDLPSGRADIRPDASAGRAACEGAAAEPVEQGRVGAGAGALIGKYAGFEHAAFGGLGSASVQVGGAVVAALSVCNAVGDIFDPSSGLRVAGSSGPPLSSEPHADLAGMNTTLVVVVTDAPLSKAQARMLSQSAHVGIARVTRPSHTVHDGDTAFVLSTCEGPEVPLMSLSLAVQEVVAASIVRGVHLANGGAA